jgi:hypothetical protein
VYSEFNILQTSLHACQGVTPDEVKDILGVDKRTFKHYVKATQERKKKVLFKHLEKVHYLNRFFVCLKSNIQYSYIYIE